MLKTWAKQALGAAKRELRRRELQTSAPHTGRAQIADGLRALGIETGDVVFLHSSLKSLGFVEGGPEAVLQALLDVIGPAGTLIVPTYYQPGGTIYSTLKLTDYVFDPTVHGSNLGALPSAFLKFPGVARSLHPTHSVSALGAQARFVTESHHLAPSVFGEGSPWERFLRLDGKLLGLGVSMGPITFYHLLEDRVGDRFPLPVRMMPAVEMPCRNAQGTVVKVPVCALDPTYMPRRIDSPGRADLRAYFWAEFTGAGLVRSGNVAGAKSWYIRAQSFLAHLEGLMGAGITIYSTAEELKARPVPVAAEA